MATSQKNIRSISLPSRLSSTSNFDSELKKLKSCYVSNSVPISSETIQSGLLGLAELYNFVEEHMITQSQANSQKSLVLQQHDQDGSVELIDSCNNIRELFQMMKENVQSLQSALRRKGLECSSIQYDIKSYLCFRKKMNKCVAKSLKTLKNLENKNVSNTISVLREATELTVSVLKDMLVFLTCPMAKSGGWNLISKLMVTKSEASHGTTSEVECVDYALSTLQGRTKLSSAGKVIDAQMVQRSLKDLDVCIEGVQQRLESLFRQMIRSRVAILNILTNQ